MVDALTSDFYEDKDILESNQRDCFMGLDIEDIQRESEDLVAKSMRLVNIGEKKKKEERKEEEEKENESENEKRCMNGTPNRTFATEYVQMSTDTTIDNSAMLHGCYTTGNVFSSNASNESPTESTSLPLLIQPTDPELIPETKVIVPGLFHAFDGISNVEVSAD